MSILFERALVLAKLEAVFRTDPLPSETIKTLAAIDATTDVDDTAENITSITHGLTAGDGPFYAVLTSGAFPTGISATTNYWLSPDTAATPADDFQVFTNRTDALALTNPVDLTDAVGVFSFVQRVSDALLVEDPDVTLDPTTVERNNVATTLSPEPVVNARQTATVAFQHEARHNGTTDGTLHPAVGPLIRACGFAQTEVPLGTGTILNDTIIPVNGATGVFTYAKTTGYVGTRPRLVVLQCTTGGGTGVAAFTLYSPASGTQAEVNTTGVVMTDSAAFTLAESAQITPTITTSFAIGDTYVFWLGPPGILYTPVSSGFDSVTLYVYFDGLLHKINGARGTFTVDGAGADLTRFSFTFQGDFVSVVDAAMPSAPVYESTQPAPNELAALTAIGGKDFVAPAVGGAIPTEMAMCAQSFSIDAAVETTFRECLNAPSSVAGALIVDRLPVGGFNPETELEASHPFWALFESADRVVFGVRVGVTQGNVVSFFTPYAQYTSLPYADRDGIRTYDVGMNFSRHKDAGNDELNIYFS